MADGVVGRVRPLPRAQRAGGWSNLLFLLPFLVVYLAMLIGPLVAGMVLSLFKADLFGVQAFVGLRNFARLVSDAEFLRTVGNTFLFVLMTVPALAAIGLALALALNTTSRMSAALRAIFFSSTVLSVTIVTLIWRMVFLPDNGLAGTVLGWFDQAPIPFLDDERLALPAIAVTSIWWCIGLPMMLFLAALQQVPRDLYEAAALDGASRWTTLWRITLPAIRRTFILVLLIEVILQFQLFGQPQLMTLGGPNNSTRPIVLFIYEAGFRRWSLGYAAAASQILFAMILVAMIAQFMVSRRKDEA